MALVFKLLRTQVTKILINPLPIVKQFDVAKGLCLGLLTGPEIAVMDQLVLQILEETLCHRIVISRSLVSHAGQDAYTFHQTPIARASIQAALARMMNNAMYVAARHGKRQQYLEWISPCRSAPLR